MGIGMDVGMDVAGDGDGGREQLGALRPAAGWGARRVSLFPEQPSTSPAAVASVVRSDRAVGR